MSDDTDFVSMYEELGLDAECGMAAFKQAYRRRVAVLHPDMQGDASDLPRLQRLNRMYEATLDFHRMHGRLPGASARLGDTRFPPPPGPDPDDAGGIADTEAMEPPRSRRRYVLAAALLAALLYWLGAHRTSIPTLDPAGPGDSAAAAWQPRASQQLELGMDTAQARRILGDPTTEHAGRWQYGPSWVDFECGKVTGWYSAPTRPLEVGRDSAHQATEGPHGAATCG